LESGYIKGTRVFSRKRPLAAGQTGIEVLLISTKLYFRTAITQTTHDIAFYQISLFDVLDSRVIRFRGHDLFAVFSPAAAAARQPTSVLLNGLALLPIHRFHDKFEITAHRVLSYNAIPAVYSLFSATTSAHRIDSEQCPLKLTVDAIGLV